MSRKSYGDGSIFQRKDGRWVATIPDFNKTGKRKAFYGATKKEALAARKEAMVQVARNEYVSSSRQRVGEYLQYWLEVHTPTIGVTSAQNYDSFFRIHCIPILGHHLLQKLTVDHIQKMVDQLWKQNYAASTISKIYTVLKAALDDAVEWEKIAKNPCKHVKLPRGEERDHVILEADQARLLIQVAQEALQEKRQIGVIILLLIGTGMRLGEVLSLHWHDIDFDKRELNVVSALKYNEKEHILFEGDPKTKSSKRRIPLSNLVLSALSTHRMNQRERRIGAATWPSDDRIIVGELKRGYVSQGTARQQFHRFLKDHGLPSMVPHDLRHNVATALLAAGVPMKTVSELLGHGDIKVTVNIYGHVTKAMQETVSDEIDRIFGS